jgi:hypothetical protein
MPANTDLHLQVLEWFEQNQHRQVAMPQHIIAYMRDAKMDIPTTLKAATPKNPRKIPQSTLLLADLV